jgi:hypothetical protein
MAEVAVMGIEVGAPPRDGASSTDDVGVELGKGIAVAVGVPFADDATSAAWIGAVGVSAERSSRTIVGVGLAPLGAAQAGKVIRVSKIKLIQILIFHSLFITHHSSLIIHHSYLSASIGRSRAARVAG